ncbi:MAG: hypothetical protein HZT43_08300 [Exiguobacterium profundum]|nr:MAG: hypothetical protein HZT43_08300 [Exiguobacterium profundum]
MFQSRKDQEVVVGKQGLGQPRDATGMGIVPVVMFDHFRMGVPAPNPTGLEDVPEVHAAILPCDAVSPLPAALG